MRQSLLLDVGALNVFCVRSTMFFKTINHVSFTLDSIGSFFSTTLHFDVISRLYQNYTVVSFELTERWILRWVLAYSKKWDAVKR